MTGGIVIKPLKTSLSQLPLPAFHSENSVCQFDYLNTFCFRQNHWSQTILVGSKKLNIERKAIAKNLIKYENNIIRTSRSTI